MKAMNIYTLYWSIGSTIAAIGLEGGSTTPATQLCTLEEISITFWVGCPVWGEVGGAG